MEDLANSSMLRKAEKYRMLFIRLQVFLQHYKEKLMLTKKLVDSLDKHVITLDHLKKLKEGYSD